MSENGFELLKLDWCQIGHVSGDHLIFQKGQLFRDGGFNETEFIGEVVISVCCEIVLLNVCLFALLIEESQVFKVSVQGWEVGVQALNMAALFVNITLEPGDGQGKGIEREGEIVRFVGEGSS